MLGFILVLVLILAVIANDGVIDIFSFLRCRFYFILIFIIDPSRSFSHPDPREVVILSRPEDKLDESLIDQFLSNEPSRIDIVIEIQLQVH